MPTFASIGLYWKPADGAADNPCRVRYRAEGAGAWREALPLWFDATDHPRLEEHSREYRGSIGGLASGTRYEIRLALARTGTLATVASATWSDSFPVARTVVIPAESTQPYAISEGGSVECNVRVDASCVIVRGLTLINAQRHGIVPGDAQDVVVDDCDASGWGRTSSGSPFGANLDSAV